MIAKFIDYCGRSPSLLCLLLMLFVLPWAGMARADDDQDQSFALHGFGTIGAARTTSDKAEFVRDISQASGAKTTWDPKLDSLLGLQGNWRISPQLEAVVQAVSRYGPYRTYRPEIDWAFLKYDPTPSLSLRAGRLGTEFFMLADSRLVGYSYLTVRPVGDYFWYLPFYSIRGADATLTLAHGENVLRGKVFYGLSDGSVPLADLQWSISGSPMVGGYVEYQLPSWVLRASYANIRFRNDLPIAGNFSALPPGLLSPAAIQASLDYLSTANSRSDYYSLGAVYDNGPWQLQFMLNHINQGSHAFESSDAGYVLAGYRVGQLTPYVGVSRVQSQRRSDPLNPVVARIQADSHSAQKTGIVGVRWDVAHNFDLKVQWDAVRGDLSSIFPVRAEQPDWTGREDVFSLTMDFVF